MEDLVYDIKKMCQNLNRAAYQQEKYAQFGAANYADASRQAVIDMREDIAQALQGRK